MDSALLPLNHKKEFIVSSLPESLREAIRLFIINISIRKIRGQENRHNSMLIHISRFTSLHQQVAVLVERYLAEIIRDVNNFGRLEDADIHSKHIKDIKETFELQLNESLSEENWESVIVGICDSVNTIIVREVHQKATKERSLEYRKDIVTNVIVIGGASLSRGFTLEGLSISYFLRSTVFYDTLMQMGRWFGYRIGYEDLCRVYLSEQTIEYFSQIIEATEDLIQELNIMAENNRTPSDFGLAVRQHPDSVLQVTARNKQKNVHEFVFNMRLDGQLKETAWLSNDEKDREKNFRAIEDIFETLKTFGNENIGSSVLWRNIDKTIVKKFVAQFKVFTRDRLGITGRMPIEFVKKYIDERNTTWDIALYSGDGEEYQKGSINIKKEVRTLNLKDGYLKVKNGQVSSGNSESIALDKEIRKNLGSNRKKIRAISKNPLLMLHILETKDFGDFAAFGISFPGNVLSQNETVNLKINTVYYNNLLKDFEDETDDEE